MGLRTAAAIIATAVSIVALGSQAPPAAAQGYGYDCAHGPDTYRVRNVEDWDQLNIRSGPSARRRVVGAIPFDGSGVHCLGPCQGNWCRISWRGIVGWTNMRFLGE